MAGTSKTTKLMNFRIENKKHSQIGELAAKKGTTVSELLRKWVDIGYQSECKSVKTVQESH
jgi:hypothetical protein